MTWFICRVAFRMRRFFSELKRRKVYRVAIAYAVAAWLVAQVVTQIFPVFEVSQWALRSMIVLLITGFPIALILAWAFDITPEGIKRTDDIDSAQAQTRRAFKAASLCSENRPANETRAGHIRRWT
jgi:hypothetical protein